MFLVTHHYVRDTIKETKQNQSSNTFWDIFSPKDTNLLQEEYQKHKQEI